MKIVSDDDIGAEGLNTSKVIFGILMVPILVLIVLSAILPTAATIFFIVALITAL